MEGCDCTEQCGAGGLEVGVWKGASVAGKKGAATLVVEEGGERGGWWIWSEREDIKEKRSGERR